MVNNYLIVILAAAVLSSSCMDQVVNTRRYLYAEPVPKEDAKEEEEEEDEDVVEVSIPGNLKSPSQVSSFAIVVEWSASTVKSSKSDSFDYFLCSGADEESVKSATKCAAATQRMNWTKGALSKSVTGLSPGTGYYFNVLARNSKGIISAYTPVQASTTTFSFSSFSLGGTASDGGSGLNVDSAGNLVVAGYFEGSIDLGCGTLSSASGTRKGFVAKFDGFSSTCLWSKALVSSVGDEIKVDITFDSADNVYAYGYFTTSIATECGTVSSGGHWDGFVAKLNASDGACTVQKVFGSAGGYEAAAGVVVDPSNQDFYVTGNIDGGFNAGGGAISGLGSTDIFVFKYTSAGAHIWSRIVGGGGPNEAWGFTGLAPSGDPIIASWTRNDNDVGCGSTNTPSKDPLLFRLDRSTGACVWSRVLQADAYEEEFSGYTMSSDKQSLYISGTMNTSLDFGCGAMTTSGGLHAPYLAKLDSSNGSCVWSSNFPSSGSQIQSDGGLVVKDNQVFLTGRYSNDIDFGSSVTLSTSQGVDGFLAAFSDDGTPSWVRSFGGSGSEEPRGLLVIDSSTFIVSGDFGTTMAVSDKSLVSNGGLDGFFGLIIRP